MNLLRKTVVYFVNSLLLFILSWSGSVWAASSISNEVYVSTGFDTRVTGTGTTEITINPTDDLTSSTGYYLNIAATAFDDSFSNAINKKQ